MKVHSLIFLLMIVCAGCDTEEAFSFDKIEPLEDYSIYIQNEEQDSIFREAVDACAMSSNFGKSVGVFGGSLSSLPESIIAKGLWKKYLHMDIKTYGKPGHGFSIKQGSIQNQVNRAIAHDIYILWASTNDYTTLREAGEATDYTVYDNFDKKKLSTQCGGINYCISRLQEINPSATIYLFTSLKFFGSAGNTVYGYEINPASTLNNMPSFYEYVQKQKECAILQDVPYFDQWTAQESITSENYSIFYKENDGYHMTEHGYFDIGIRQLLFLAKGN